MNELELLDNIIFYKNQDITKICKLIENEKNEMERLYYETKSSIEKSKNLKPNDKKILLDHLEKIYQV